MGLGKRVIGSRNYEAHAIYILLLENTVDFFQLENENSRDYFKILQSLMHLTIRVFIRVLLGYDKVFKLVYACGAMLGQNIYRGGF